MSSVHEMSFGFWFIIYIYIWEAQFCNRYISIAVFVAWLPFPTSDATMRYSDGNKICVMPHTFTFGPGI
jgi:hypothetical protein